MSFLLAEYAMNLLCFSFFCFFRCPPFNLSFFSFVFASWLDSFPSGSPIQYPFNIISYRVNDVSPEGRRNRAADARGSSKTTGERGRESPGGSREEPGNGEEWGMWWEGGREKRERRKIIDFSPSLLRCEKWRRERERGREKGGPCLVDGKADHWWVLSRSDAWREIVA